MAYKGPIILALLVSIFSSVIGDGFLLKSSKTQGLDDAGKGAELPQPRNKDGGDSHPVEKNKSSSHLQKRELIPDELVENPEEFAAIFIAASNPDAFYEVANPKMSPDAGSQDNQFFREERRKRSMSDRPRAFYPREAELDLLKSLQYLLGRERIIDQERSDYLDQLLDSDSDQNEVLQDRNSWLETPEGRFLPGNKFHLPIDRRAIL